MQSIFRHIHNSVAVGSDWQWKKENPVTIVVSSSNRMGLFQETQKLQSAWIGCVKK